MSNEKLEISRMIEVKIQPTVTEIARIFCEYSAGAQALFFNQIGKITEDWDTHFSVQMQAVSEEEYLMDERTRSIMTIIGEYGSVFPKKEA